MIDVSQLVNSTLTNTTTKTNGSSSDDDTLGQDAFLQLLVAQLSNQDPFNTTDPTAFVSQLAEFSQVSSVQSMQEEITSLTESLRSSQVLDGTSLVGHDVLTATDTAKLGTTGEITGAVDLPEGTSEAVVAVTDSSGALVRRIQLPAQQGTTEFTWNGLADNGSRAAAGTYTITAYSNVGGEAVQVETQLYTKVDSVTIDPSTYQLTVNTDIGSVALSDVRRVM